MGKKKMSNYNVEIGFRNKCCARGAERELCIFYFTWRDSVKQSQG